MGYYIENFEISGINVRIVSEILKFLIQNLGNFDIHGIKRIVFKIFDSVIQMSDIAPDFSKSCMDPVNLEI